MATVSTPTNVDAPLEYLTVDSYSWPKPTRAKRSRMEEETRKLRHRENQRRFMQRKQAKLMVFRKQIELMELQLKYLEALRDEKLLRQEGQQLNLSQLDQLLPDDMVDYDTTKERSDFVPLDPSKSDELDTIISEVLLAL